MRTRVIPWLITVAACTPTTANAPDAKPGKGCPVGLHFETLAGSVAQVGTAGHLLTGAPIGAQFSVDVVSHDESCSIAEFSGPAQRTPGDASFHRCMTQPAKACTTDDDCPVFRCLANPGLGGVKVCQNTGASCSSDSQCKLGAHAGNFGACQFVLGAPLPNGPPRSGCVLVALAGPGGTPGIHGTIDLAHGTVDADTFDIASWIDNLGACNLCVGDDHPNDGVKHGTCMIGAASSGPEPAPNPVVACDAAGTNQQYPGAYSFDCLTNPVFASLALALGPMSTDGARWKLDGSRPASSSGRSWCGVCQTASGATTWDACTTSAQCGGGTCVGTTADGVALSANNCLDGKCTYDPATGGTCTQAGSGAQPTIFCLPSANDAVATSPGISTILDEDRLNIVLGGLGCVPAGRALDPTNPILRGADSSIGLPGPVVDTTAAQIEKLYGGSP